LIFQQRKDCSGAQQKMCGPNLMQNSSDPSMRPSVGSRRPTRSVNSCPYSRTAQSVGKGEVEPSLLGSNRPVRDPRNDHIEPAHWAGSVSTALLLILDRFDPGLAGPCNQSPACFALRALFATRCLDWGHTVEDRQQTIVRARRDRIGNTVCGAMPLVSACCRRVASRGHVSATWHNRTSTLGWGPC